MHGGFRTFARLLANALVAGLLYGRVTDLTTGQPLTNVTVTVGSHTAKTGAHGRYKLAGIAPGTYTLTATSDDVPPQQRAVVVKGAQTQLDLRVCSTTLDYACGSAGPGPGPG